MSERERESVRERGKEREERGKQGEERKREGGGANLHPPPKTNKQTKQNTLKTVVLEEKYRRSQKGRERGRERSLLTQYKLDPKVQG